MKRVTDPLQKTVRVFVTRQGGRLPMAVVGTAQGTPIHYRLPVASAQVKSAILLAGLKRRVKPALMNRPRRVITLKYAALFRCRCRRQGNGIGGRSSV